MALTNVRVRARRVKDTRYCGNEADWWNALSGKVRRRHSRQDKPKSSTMAATPVLV